MNITKLYVGLPSSWVFSVYVEGRMPACHNHHPSYSAQTDISLRQHSSGWLEAGLSLLHSYKAPQHVSFNIIKKKILKQNKLKCVNIVYQEWTNKTHYNGWQ